jgi:pimeloyl-ACP methyl ester carboxylesterase
LRFLVFALCFATVRADARPAILFSADLQSPLLSAFRHAPTFVRADLLVPDDYLDSPEKRYPVIYWIHAFGGDYRRQFGAWQDALRREGAEFIVVSLDAALGTGHHEFADSANNGPWGEALVHEFIPELERRFHMLATARTRFVSGHSSGGWSSLWLQANYPDTFGGVWSIAPDPIDFRDFTGPDLTRSPPQNFYRDPAGHDYGFVRRRGFDTETLRQYVTADDRQPPPRQQFGSFDAVFSPRGEGGAPERLFDHRSGTIDPVVAKYWDANYDIAHLIAARWPELGPKLRGKVHVFVGTEDTFHLDTSVRAFQQDLKPLGDDFDVVYVPGADHFTVFDYDRGLIRHIVREMKQTLELRH